MGHVSAWERAYLADSFAARASTVKPVRREVDAVMEREWGTTSYKYIDGQSHGESAKGTRMAAPCVQLLMENGWELSNSL